MATVSNLYIDQGSDFSVIVTLTNQDGTPLDLGAFVVKGQFRKSYQSSIATNFTISIFNETAGKIKIQLPADASSAIQAGRYLYDIEVSNALGEKRRALEGIVVITPEITRI